MTDKVRYAKKDVYAEVDEGDVKVRRKVAIEGQPVPREYADLVDDKDTTTDAPDSGLRPLGLSTPERVAAAERVEPEHEEARAAAAATPGPDEDGAPRKGRRSRSRVAAGDAESSE